MLRGSSLLFSGSFVQRGDFYLKDDFINKISIIMNRTNISALSDNAYQFAQFNFSPKQHLNNILPIYHNLLIS